MIQYPILFHGQASGVSGIKSNWKVSAKDYDSTCAVPVEFEGAGGAFTPEDFFLLAVENCFFATFKVFAEYSKLQYESIDVETTLTVDKDSQQPIMKSCHLKINIKSTTDQRRATSLVKKAMEGGFILNSIKTTLTYDLIFS
jgi:organic hydroperoxide reductase OsmC/OhrA